MEVKLGYKQTEVGVVPEDWDVKQLSELGQFKNGINKKKEDFGHGFPFINLMDVFGIPKVSAASADFGLVDSTAAERKVYDLKAGDVLFVRSSVKPEGIGLTTLIPEDLPDTVFSGFLIRFRDTGLLDPEFKEHCFWEEGFRSRLMSNSTVSANTNINQPALKRIQIAFPLNRLEQHSIATALSDVNGLLAALEGLIAKKRDLKQAAVQQLLTGQTRLPGFHGEWKRKSLSAVCSMKSGEGITSASIDQFSQYPCYGGNGLRGYTTRFTHDGTYALIGRQGALCGNVSGVEGQFFASEHSIVVTAFPDTDIRWLTSVLGRMDLNQYSESSAQPGLSVSKILKLEITAPATKAEQTATASVLVDMDAELAALEARRNKTRDLKQAMMQELLTGKARLVPVGAAHA
jgi:type I restriction enzyme S subunit